MTFAVCSLVLGDEYKKRMALCTKTQEEHAARHGYTRITDESCWDPSRPHPWSKIKLLQKYLNHYDHLFWLDADVIIMNPERKIETFIELLPTDKFLFIGHDLSNLNSGVFVIRNCPLAHEFLADVWSMTQYTHHPWWEQAAIIELSRAPKYRPFIEVLPRKYIQIMNAYDPVIDPVKHWLPGDWALHLAGLRVSGHDEVAKQREYLPRVTTDPAGQARLDAYVAERAAINRAVAQQSAGVPC